MPLVASQLLRLPARPLYERQNLHLTSYPLTGNWSVPSGVTEHSSKAMRSDVFHKHIKKQHSYRSLMLTAKSSP